MGWLFTAGLSRSDLIRERTKSWEYKGASGRCLAHACVGNVLWMVCEIRKPESQVDRFIECDLMAPKRGYGWGYKDMTESMHPYYYSCPLAYLDMAPVACEEWRVEVRKYHARRNSIRERLRTFKIGDTVPLVGCSIPSVTLTSLRPLRGLHGGTLYRVPIRLLG